LRRKGRIEEGDQNSRKFGVVKITIGKWKYVRYSSKKII
jgi:hypothetical protein